MKSIYEIRCENLKDLIYREFNGVQSRMAEKMQTQANLINRWANGKKVIGDQSARKIEKAGNKPTNWLDIDHALYMSAEPQQESPGDIGLVAAQNLKLWMSENRALSSQQRVAEAAGLSQATINRLLRNEASVSISNLEAIAKAFGRNSYELLTKPGDPDIISYDTSRYRLLPQSEKDKISSYIDFVIIQNNKPQK